MLSLLVSITVEEAYKPADARSLMAEKAIDLMGISRQHTPDFFKGC